MVLQVPDLRVPVLGSPTLSCCDNGTFVRVQTLLAVAALLAAVVALVPAFFTTWWLAGSDDEALNRVAPALGPVSYTHLTLPTTERV